MFKVKALCAKEAYYYFLLQDMILYRCMCQFQDTLSTPRLSTSSKKGITPGRVHIHRNPFDRFVNSYNGPSQVGIIILSIPTWAGVFGNSHNGPSQVRIISTLPSFRNCPQHLHESIGAVVPPDDNSLNTASTPHSAASSQRRARVG